MNYTLAFDQYRDSRGELHFSTLDIAPALVRPFCDQLLLNMEAYAQFEDAFFFHEWRGLKGATIHDPQDPDACNSALLHITRHIDFHSLHLEDWHVDVGIEISTPGHVLQWLNQAHSDIIAYLLPSASPQHIQRLLNSSNYHNDTAAHMYALAGFRATVHSLGTDDHVSYINVYTTDKSSTYQLHTGAFKRHFPSNLMPRAINRLSKDIDLTLNLFHTLAGLDTNDPQPGNIRAEARIQLTHAADYMRSFPVDPLFNSFVCIPALEWWFVPYLFFLLLNSHLSFSLYHRL